MIIITPLKIIFRPCKNIEFDDTFRKYEIEKKIAKLIYNKIVMKYQEIYNKANSEELQKKVKSVKSKLIIIEKFPDPIIGVGKEEDLREITDFEFGSPIRGIPPNPCIRTTLWELSGKLQEEISDESTLFRFIDEEENKRGI